MNALCNSSCEPCRLGAPVLADDEIRTLQAEVPEWQVTDRAGVKQLERVFKFRSFREALDFTVQVGGLAEAHGHHPAILTEWGRTTVTWWTHKIRGLHRNDFIMAARTDAAYGAAGAKTTPA